ncbi:FAD-dependent monooxygenase [Marinobacter sp. HN1S83]|uniref:FAD-dependent monooxygenase n=1 Tax=Marinobacter sp. HN1S83 TaxID=3382301 RepID=UPI00387B07DE
MRQQDSVLIVGAGPVGMATAATLAKHGIRPIIIERNASPTSLSKAIGIHAITLELMQTLGLSEQFVAHGVPHRYATLNAGSREILRVDFEQIQSSYPMVLALPQSSTERLLRQTLNCHDIEIKWNTELTQLKTLADGSCEVALVNGKVRETRQVQWVLACDGSHSTVRRLQDIPFPGGEYERAFILGDVMMDWPDGNPEQLQFFLSRQGYILIVPLPEGRHRIICQTDAEFIAGDKTGERRAITLDDLQRIVDRNGPGGIKVHSPQWLTSAPFYHRMADNPIQGNIILLGDAFHLFSPLGGQGLNTGFQDAFNLGWKLAWHLKGWADRSLVETYATERTQVAQRIQQVTAKTTSFITGTSLPLDLIRRYLVPLYGSRQSVQNSLPWLYSGLRQCYTNSPLVNQQPLGQLQSGHRLPYLTLSQPGSTREQPIDQLIHGQAFTLFLVNRKLSSADIEPGVRELANFTRHLPVLGISINHESSGFDTYRVEQNALKAWLGKERGGWVLVRPDGHVATVAAIGEEQRISGYLKDLLPGLIDKQRTEQEEAA